MDASGSAIAINCATLQTPLSTPIRLRFRCWHSNWSLFQRATLIELKLEKFADTEVKSAVSLKVSRLMRIPGYLRRSDDEAVQFHLFGT